MKKSEMVLFTSLLFTAWTANSTTLFFDNFESGLSAWNTYSGQIVTAPLDASTYHNVLHFTSDVSGGDAFTASSITLTSGETYRFSLDYLGYSGAQSYGALSLSSSYVATGQEWVLSPSSLVSDGQWHYVYYDFTAPWLGNTNIWISLEQNSGTVGAYFDNVSLATVNNQSNVPEPSTISLAGIGLILLLSTKLIQAVSARQESSSPQKR